VSGAAGHVHRQSPPALLILALFAGLTIVWSWPLATQLSTRVAFDPGDPMLNTWILWWNSQAVPFTTTWWNPPIFYPMPGALALSEHLAGISPFTTPLLRLGASPALAYNAALLLSCTLSGFFAYLLVHRLTGSTAAALCAGVAYAFAPFRAGQLSHLQVLTSQWMPLMLLALHGYVDGGSRRWWLALFGVAWILQSLSNGYYLLFTPALIGLWLLWFTIAPGKFRAAVHIVVAWMAASLVLLPVLLQYRRIHQALGLFRTRGEIEMFSARATSIFNPPPMLSLWPERNVPVVEDFLFPGLTVVIVIAAGLLMMTRRTKQGAAPLRVALFYVFAAAVMAAMTLGPAAPEAGIAGWLKPYQWLMLLPGFDGVRVPARFGMLMALCLAIAGGLLLPVLLPARRTVRMLMVGVVLAGLMADGAIEPLTGSATPGRVELPNVPAGAVLELPPDDTVVNVGAMFRSIHHRLPLINGYSGYIPPHYAVLGQSLRRGDPSALLELARGRNLLLLVAERNDPAGDYRRMVEAIPGIQRRELSGAGWSYLLPAQPRERRAPGGAPHAFTTATLPRRHVVLDFGVPRTIRTLEFPLRDRYPELDSRIAIEASGDGNQWQTVWEHWTAGAVIAGALEDEVRVPVRFTLPDVPARYLRIHPASDWLIAELRISGPK
jgi:hypothetical protein